MITIKLGPAVQLYASCCVGCDPQEVLEWINLYINGPWPENMIVEESDEKRRDSVFAFVEREVMNSITVQIKISLEMERWRLNPSVAAAAE